MDLRVGLRKLAVEVREAGRVGDITHGGSGLVPHAASREAPQRHLVGRDRDGGGSRLLEHGDQRRHSLEVKAGAGGAGDDHVAAGKQALAQVPQQWACTSGPTGLARQGRDADR